MDNAELLGRKLQLGPESCASLLPGPEAAVKVDHGNLELLRRDTTCHAGADGPEAFMIQNDLSDPWLPSGSAIRVSIGYLGFFGHYFVFYGAET